jgi:hypothetical protein
MRTGEEKREEERRGKERRGNANFNSPLDATAFISSGEAVYNSVLTSRSCPNSSLS